MKFFRITLFSLASFAGVCCAQKYHSLDEIYKLINDSKMNYRIKTFADSDSIATEKFPILEHGLVLWQERNDEPPILETYHHLLSKNPYLANYLQQADKALAAGRPAAARRAWLAVLANAPDDSQDMTLVGRTCAMEGDSVKALACYRKAISINFYDFLAHQLLAADHLRHNRIDSAIVESTIAHILNRNHLVLQAELKGVLKKQGKRYAEWEFHPIYAIEETPDSRIIKYDLAFSEWLTYALCKALWRYEPGYRDIVLDSIKAPAGYIEELECAQIILQSRRSNNELSQDKAIQQLILAAKDDLLQEYVLYEIILRREPSFVFYLSQTQITGLAKYVQRHRIF
jgi:hypothetical protein